MSNKGESLTNVSEKITSSGDVNSMFSSIYSSPVITTMKLERYEDHLVKTTSDIVASERTKWSRIDAQLCNLLWNSLDLLNLFKSCKTCYKIWTKAKTLYTNDIQHIYKVVSDLVQLQQTNQDMASYLGQIDTLKDQFDSLMPLFESFTTQEQQRDKFFMVLALKRLQSDLSSIRDQIVASSSVPSLIDILARLLCIG
ncbi:hypothetical protein R3W88_001923 [Solanum pinnatisectum]|uniref:Uncharacterized protein n=1 Tax=Solanum pinnatisectum TaxID=50273 RepID=A0AAV9MKD1_9SOLN|nr:hypothetical protein R3W88_001923 [Solanum pinnatisectum]